MTEVVLPNGGTDTEATPVEVPAEQTTPRQAYADWPQPNDQRAQPWENEGVSREDRDKLLDNPGTPDTASAIVIGHSMPILSSGSGGEQASFVRELGRRLNILGYTTSIGTNVNPWANCDESVMGAVERFREEHNVQEDPTAWGGNTAAGRQRADAHIGPWTWEAIIRASDRKLAE